MEVFGDFFKGVLDCGRIRLAIDAEFVIERFHTPCPGTL
jgi:hypothetical protein